MKQSKFEDNENRGQSRELINLRRDYERKIIINHLKISNFVNIITLLIILVTIFFVNWKKYDGFWLGLVIVQFKGKYISYRILMTICHPNLCDSLIRIKLIGVISFFAFLFGIACHIVYIILVFLIIINKLPKSKIFRPFYYKFITLGCYLGAISLWFFFVLIYNLELKIGWSFILNASSVFVYLITLVYYKNLKNSLKKQNNVDYLLNADNYIFENDKKIKVNDINQIPIKLNSN